jgi:hypothetical protein
MLSAAVPVFVTVTVCGGLIVPGVCGPNVKLIGVNVTNGPATAVPETVTVCGLSGAESAISSFS